MTEVLNKRVSGVPLETKLVDRTTRYGNPFQIGRDGTRADVIEKHKRWLDGRFFVLKLRAQRRWVLDHVRELREYDAVVCWCAPQPCHADYLVELAYS